MQQQQQVECSGFFSKTCASLLERTNVFAAMPIWVTPADDPSSPTSPVNKQHQVRTSTPPPPGSIAPRRTTSTTCLAFGCCLYIQNVVQSTHEYRAAAHYAQPAPTPRQRARRLHDAGTSLTSPSICSANNISPTQKLPAALRISVSTLRSRTSRNRTPR
jgi:hypothetical protein